MVQHIVRITAAVAAAFCLGCSNDVTAPPPAVHGVSIDASIGAHSSAGTSIAITFTNNGTSTAYLDICPSVRIEQFVGGQWVSVGPQLDCVRNPVADALTPGSSLVVTSAPLAAGRYRFSRNVGAHQDLSDGLFVVSSALDVD